MSISVQAQTIEVIKVDRLYAMMDDCDDKFDICIYNFWATWCAPCIRELPHFEALNKNNKRININLISLDEKEDLLNKVEPFIHKKQIESSVFLLDETDFNEIIPGISTEWTGAIPATLIIDNKTGKKYFYEKEFKKNELENAIEEILTINN
jgi:thiol-disulfide isomerase/thioredoxin